MKASWEGGQDDIESHYWDLRLTFPDADEIPIIAALGTKWKYKVNARDTLFLKGLFTFDLTAGGERAAIVLGRNYLENQTKISPALYTMQRATNDLSYSLLFGRLGLLRHHVPVSPMTYFSGNHERHMAAFKEVEGNKNVWVIDMITKAGAIPYEVWEETVKDVDKCWVDFKSIPGVNLG
jgi:hypothetical protein